MSAAPALFAEAALELSHKRHSGPLTHGESLALLDAAIACPRRAAGDARSGAASSADGDRALLS